MFQMFVTFLFLSQNLVNIVTNSHEEMFTNFHEQKIKFRDKFGIVKIISLLCIQSTGKASAKRH